MDVIPDTVNYIMKKSHNLEYGIERFVCPFTYQSLHWVNMVAEMKPTKETGDTNILCCIDYAKKSTKKLQKLKVKRSTFFAKFFGLIDKYYSEPNKNILEDEDFDGEDIAKYWDEAIKHIKKMNLSVAQKDTQTAMFDLKLLSMRGTEDYNQCGTLLLMDCMDYLLPIRKKDTSTKAQQKFKKKIAIFIYDLLWLLYKDEYDVLNSHLVMNVSDVLDVRYVSMFRRIHHLFNIGILNLNINDGENANKFMLDFSGKNGLIKFEKFFRNKCPQHQLPVTTCYLGSMREDDTLPQLRQLALQTLEVPRLFFKDISETRIYYDIILDETKSKDQNRFVSQHYWTPYAIREEVLKLYMPKYRNRTKTDDIKKKLLESYMKQFVNYVLFEEENNAYKLVAAMTIENDVDLIDEGRKHAIIHISATSKSGENEAYFNTLLEKVMSVCGLKSKEIVFVTQIGKFRYKQLTGVYKPSDMFVNNKFKEFKNKFVDELLEEGSTYLHGKGSWLLRQFHSKVTTKTIKYGVFRSEVRNIRFINDNYEVYSHTFGWNKAMKYEIPNASSSVIKEAKSKIGCSIKMEGGGHRSKMINLPTGSIVRPIPRKFHQAYYKYNGSNCTWLAAAMLINIEEPNIADLMLAKLDGSKKLIKHFEYMQLTKYSRNQKKYFSKDDQPKPLVQYLEDFYKHQLKKVNANNIVKGDKCGYMAYLLNKDTKGYYLCQITTEGGQKSHIVGLDCTNGEIYDCMETHTLKLNRENLDYISDVKLGGISGIYVCKEIIKQLQKKTKSIVYV